MGRKKRAEGTPGEGEISSDLRGLRKGKSLSGGQMANKWCLRALGTVLLPA